MTKLILIRPGTTQFDLEGRILGTLDVPLSIEGDQEVAQMVEALKQWNVTAIYTAECQSALQTAERIATAMDGKAKVVEKLQNVDHGLWQGKLLEEVKRKQPKVFKQWREHPETICPPEGEMIGDALARVKTAIAKVLKKNRDGTIALVAPEPLASLIRSHLLGEDLSQSASHPSGCGTWDVIDLEPASPAV